MSIDDVAHAIQLALAPAFLLTAIAGLLNVMTGRLARIIDRGRFLSDRSVLSDKQHAELHGLERRRHSASAGITATTFSALLLCLVIAVLFLEVMLQLELKWLVGVLFTGVTVVLVVGLTFFLHEVHLATRTLRIQLPASQRLKEAAGSGVAGTERE